MNAKNKVMKMKIAIVALLCISSLKVMGQVPEMSAKDSTFLRAIDIFLDSMTSHEPKSKKFIITAMIRKLEVVTRPASERPQSEILVWPGSYFKWSYSLVLQAQADPMISDSQVASCKFKYRGREVYMFFGEEYFVEYLDRDRTKIKRAEPRGIIEPGERLVFGTMLLEIDWKKIEVTLFTL